MPITLEKIQRAMSEMAGQKSPGPEGLPVEIYLHYGRVLLPELMRALNWSVRKRELPASVRESTIIVIQKEGQDPPNTASYRLISLLNSDMKIHT